MSFYALGDLHLSLTTDKPMSIFGQTWVDHMERIETQWRATVQAEDIVLLPGDLSWAMHLSDAVEDLQWIERLPGTKVMIRGNHDYWWNGITKVRSALGPKSYAIQNDAFSFAGFAIAGSRGWLLPGHPHFTEDDLVIYKRELERLRLSLMAAAKFDQPIIAMLHYPPCSHDGEGTQFTELFDEYNVRLCVYGHLHGAAHRFAFNGLREKTAYQLASADYADFAPIKLDL